MECGRPQRRAAEENQVVGVRCRQARPGSPPESVVTAAGTDTSSHNWREVWIVRRRSSACAQDDRPCLTTRQPLHFGRGDRTQRTGGGAPLQPTSQRDDHQQCGRAGPGAAKASTTTADDAGFQCANERSSAASRSAAVESPRRRFREAPAHDMHQRRPSRNHIRQIAWFHGQKEASGFRARAPREVGAWQAVSGTAPAYRDIPRGDRRPRPSPAPAPCSPPCLRRAMARRPADDINCVACGAGSRSVAGRNRESSRGRRARGRCWAQVAMNDAAIVRRAKPRATCSATSRAASTEVRPRRASDSPETASRAGHRRSPTS